MINLSEKFLSSFWPHSEFLFLFSSSPTSYGRIIANRNYKEQDTTARWKIPSQLNLILVEKNRLRFVREMEPEVRIR
uniref:Uncharacterized protein n=1 Tax=Ciona intestinalis TaxID=7719 RepID=H2XVF2_CIOIN